MPVREPRHKVSRREAQGRVTRLSQRSDVELPTDDRLIASYDSR